MRCVPSSRSGCGRSARSRQPDHIQWAPGLPKTRSGKIMQRILRKIAANEHEHLGDALRRSPIPPSSPTLSRTAARRAREASRRGRPRGRDRNTGGCRADHARDLEPRMDDAAAVFDALAARCYGRDRRPSGEDRSIPCDLAPEGRWSGRTSRASARSPLRSTWTSSRARSTARTPRAIFPGTPTASRGASTCRTSASPSANSVRCNRDYESLGLPEDTVRWGADVTIEPGAGARCAPQRTPEASCNRDPLTAARDDRRLLQRQVPVLEAWIDGRAARRRRSASLATSTAASTASATPRGMRRAPSRRCGRRSTTATRPVPTSTNPGEARGAVGCGNAYGERMPIDYLILGERLAGRLVPGSFRAWATPPAAAGRITA